MAVLRQGGANIRNVLAARELRASFADKVYETAGTTLYRSGQTLEKEKTKFGIGAEKPPLTGRRHQAAAGARPEGQAGPTRHWNKLTLIDVGYADPPAQSTSSDSSRYGGEIEAGRVGRRRGSAPVCVQDRPAAALAPVEGDGMTTWSTVAAVTVGSRSG